MNSNLSTKAIDRIKVCINRTSNILNFLGDYIVSKKITQKQRLLLVEARVRLEDIIYVLKTIEKLLKYDANQYYSGENDRTVPQKLRFYSEDFYYRAFRIFKILTKELPHENLSIFKNVKGSNITLVRNKLLEHHFTDEDSGILTMHFMYDSEEGPIIKGARKKDQWVAGFEKKNRILEKENKKGLISHLEEFLTSFDSVICNTNTDKK